MCWYNLATSYWINEMIVLWFGIFVVIKLSVRILTADQRCERHLIIKTYTTPHCTSQLLGHTSTDSIGYLTACVVNTLSQKKAQTEIPCVPYQENYLTKPFFLWCSIINLVHKDNWSRGNTFVLPPNGIYTSKPKGQLTFNHWQILAAF